MSELHQIVLDIFRELEESELGVTDSELVSFYRIHAAVRMWPAVRPETARKRRSDLTGMGQIVDSGFRRLNTFGSPEIVWTLEATS